MPLAYLGLGTNLGHRGTNLRRALLALQRFAEIEGVSSVYASEPVGYRDQPDFWNMAARIRTDLSPAELLAASKAIERDLGRRPSFRNAPRVIDIDILLYDDLTVSSPDLTIPHPRLLERAFVLLPLVELDPELRHPGTQRRLREYLEEAATLERAVRLFPGEDLMEADESVE